ncbi:MAG: hypothetical protein ACPL3S_02935 [Halothiobacillaceae bacterium]
MRDRLLIINEVEAKLVRRIFDDFVTVRLLVALTRAFYWKQLLDDGVVDSGSDIAQREGLHHSTVNELLRLTLLEPAIIQTILAGQQPKCMSLLWFLRNPLPTDWVAQREVVTAFDA